MTERLSFTQIEEGVGDLIRQGRRPLLFPVQVGSASVMEYKVFCLIPPEGTQFGDSYHAVDGDQAILEFVSPHGEVRGIADLYELTPEKADIFQKKVDEAIDVFLASK